MGVANTTFIMTYARLMRDLPFERPERVAVVRTLDGRGREGTNFTTFFSRVLGVAGDIPLFHRQ